MEILIPTAAAMATQKLQAGAVASLNGKRVAIVDKATFPRDKCCGDGLTTLALRELAPLGLTPAQVPNWQDVHEV